MNINSNYQNLSESYLFSRIANQVKAYKEGNPANAVISLGIGDVTQPLAPTIIEAMQHAILDMSKADTFRGYGPEQGYSFLRQAICRHYAEKGVLLKEDEVFVSDGAKSDLGNILDLFSADNTVLMPDPVYPAYVDANVMDGRKVLTTKGCVDNDFLPLPDKHVNADIIYLCSPNNPTGAVYTKEHLKIWIDYAQQKNAIILFDSAYESFIRSDVLPTSIFQIEGAKECAIEICSFSKTAGFTGLRCGYTVVPQELKRQGSALQRLWLRRQTTKFNGVPYIVQRAAEAALSEMGQKQTKQAIDYYLQNAQLIRETLQKRDMWFTGGVNAPYVWFKCPNNMMSWDFFDYLLEKCGVVGTPGVGFGDAGEGFFRFTSFGSREDIATALSRLENL